MPAVPLEALRRVLGAEPELRWAYLFGSAAREASAWRDLDVGVVGPAPWGLTRLGRLALALEQATGHRVDLVDLGAAPPRFVLQALRDGARVLVDRDPDARRLWEADRISRGIDFEPTYRSALAAWRRRLQGDDGREAR